MMAMHQSISSKDAVDLGVDPEPAEGVPQSHVGSHSRGSEFGFKSGSSKDAFSGNSGSGQLSSDSAPPEGILGGDSGGSDLGSQSGSAQSRLSLNVIQVWTVVPRVPELTSLLPWVIVRVVVAGGIVIGVQVRHCPD